MLHLLRSAQHCCAAGSSLVDGPEADKWVASVYWATETMSTVGFGASPFSTLCSEGPPGFAVLPNMQFTILASPCRADLCLLHPVNSDEGGIHALHRS